MTNVNVLKAGEINAIVKNFDAKLGRLRNNCIVLNQTEEVLLRTNGEVIYGLYYTGNVVADKKEVIEFTHNPKFQLPYVKTTNFKYYKPLVLKAWEEAYTDLAKERMAQVQDIITKLLNKEEILAPVPQAPVAKEEVKQETKTIEKEVKDMTNTNTANTKETVKMNVMEMAHKIRRELKLEGHYHAQMKIALTLAWKEIKEALNNIEVPAAIETPETNTYNAAPEVKEEVPAPPVTQAPVVEEPKAPEQQKPVATPPMRGEHKVYLSYLKDGQAIFSCKYPNGMSKPCYKMAARNMVDLDRTFSRGHLQKLLNSAPFNTTIEYYGDFTYLTFMNDESLRKLAFDKGITLTLGVAPSGDVA